MKTNTNKEKLNDAVGMLDGEILQTAMTRAADMRMTRLTRRATLRRRAAVLLAACLSLTLLVGALLAIPLMRADETPAASEKNTFPAYAEAPMVKLISLSATETATVSDPAIPSEPINTHLESIESILKSYLVLSFDCEPGETITVCSEDACLGLIGQPLGEDTDLSPSGEYIRLAKQIFHEGGLYQLDKEVNYFQRELTVDPSTSSIRVDIPRKSAGGQNDAILRFTVKNGEGQITGAGSIYVCIRYALNREEMDVTWMLKDEVTRSAVLGSVRFDDPAAVTEEQARALTDTFAARAEEVKATLSFEPATAHERLMYARASIVAALYDGRRISGFSTSVGGSKDYSVFSVSIQTGEGNEDREEHRFLIFSDYTWVEMTVCPTEACNLWMCHGCDACPVTQQEGIHHPLAVGCVLTTVDGRVFEMTAQERDGIMMCVPVEITSAAD